MRVRSIAAAAALLCCASPIFAQSLKRVQIIGLQQQLRDDNCGVTHVTGRMDAMTKRAAQKCMQKYNVSSGGVPALLAAMNIGLGPNDSLPSLASAGQVGLSSSAMGGSTQTGATGRMTSGVGSKQRMHRSRRRQVRDTTNVSTSSDSSSNPTMPTNPTTNPSNPTNMPGDTSSKH
jgi:hypothetical protein